MAKTSWSPFNFLGRRKSGREDRASSRGNSSARNGSVPAGGRSSGSTGTPRGSSTPEVEPATASQGGQAFRVKVPIGAKPGDSIRVRAPDGRLVEIDLPSGCTPGQKVTIEIDPQDPAADAARTLKQLTAVVKTNFEVTQASCTSLRERLKEELELQKGLWASASSCPQSFAMRQQAPQDWSIAPAGNLEELSQTQVLVFAAAEAGDGKQLLAALVEAKKFSAVSRSLEECCEQLNTAEEAMLTWQCLLDALQAENRHEIEVWVEEAKGLGLEAPSGLANALQHLCRREEDSLQHFAKCKEMEGKIQFAMEAGDPDLLAEVVGEAESMGLQHIRSTIMQQAQGRLRAYQQEQRQRFMGGPEAAAGVPAPKPATPPSAAPSTPVGGQWRPRPKSPPAGETSSQRAGASSPVDQEPTARSPGSKASYSAGFPGTSGAGGATSSSARGGGAEAGAGPSPGTRPTSAASFGGGPAGAASSTPYTSNFQAPDDGKTVKDLLEECKRLGVDTTGCTDRDDLRRLLINRPQPKEQPKAPQAAGFVRQVPANQVNSASQAFDPNTVWGRQFPPYHLVTKRSKSLHLLGLDPHRTPAASELRSAYRKAAMECHPDRAQNHQRQDQAKDLFQKVKEAFDFLSSQ